MAATELWLVRHGESIANIAASASEQAGLETLPVDIRDADVPLSPVGEAQAAALGRWLGAQPEGERPTTAWSSSYWRARQTATIAVATAGADIPIRGDERLRDRELGVLDLLTTHGVEARYPGEADRRRWLGKFYYRPPGGESWADIALRIRSLLGDLDRADVPERVLISSHDAVVMTFIYVCTGLDEAGLLDFVATHTVGNASLTRLTRRAGEQLWSLEEFALSDHLELAGVPATQHEGDPRVHPE